MTSYDCNVQSLRVLTNCKNFQYNIKCIKSTIINYEIIVSRTMQHLHTHVFYFVVNRIHVNKCVILYIL